MRAIQIVELSGPESALKLVDIPEPDGDGVVIDVRAAGVSFPEVLQTRGAYQLKPDLPFVPGSEVAGMVKRAGGGFEVGDRVAA
ncbi:MAG TPA: alcohol dehydrogenase catalytic domain-containing protein, partial [Solirubrobacter sp.]